MGPRRPTGDFRIEDLEEWLARQREGGRSRRSGNRPPPGEPRSGGSGGSGGGRFPVGLLGVIVAVVLVWFLLSAAVNPLTDYLWFQNVGFGSVWTTQFAYTTGLFGLGVVVSAIVLLVNLVLAWRFSHDPSEAAAAAQARVHTPDGYPGEQWVALAASLSRGAIRAVLILVAVLLALFFGLGLSSTWQTVALWLHRVPYSASGAPALDPIFHLDLGWWMFSLPMLHLVTDLAATLLVVSLLLTGAAYGLAALRGGDATGRAPVLHLAVIGTLLLLDVAAVQWLGRYDLSYTQNGFVVGVTATDATVRLPLVALTAVTSLVFALGLVALAIVRRPQLARRAAYIGGGWYLALILGGAVVPAAYQQFVVAPNQNQAEAPYIANNIALTRKAFALDTWKVESYTGRATLTAADVSNDQATFNNARLWDYRPLAATLDQLQTVRQYYNFTSVDIDRYDINGQPTEVMLSAREMALDKSQSNPSWIAEHILYTHGYGLAMVPVNAVDANGLPDLIIRDLPITESPGAPKVTQPRIYFGERPSTWVLVGAKSSEFDYPSSSGNGNDVDTRYAGTAGLPVGSPLERLLWSWRLGDVNLMISDQVTAQTKLLIHRSLADRLGTLAPFLALDGDPYLVVAPNGHLVYVQDAYTTTAAVPDATTTSDSTLGRTYNYIRNSVKITVDAYDGTTTFYVNDPSDPLIRAWEGIFPAMFKPLSDMPAGLRAHLRTPEAMFNAQTQMYEAYHVTDVASFYKSDNLWTVPTVTEGNAQVLAPEAYYVEMRLPDQATPEFVLIQPMVPKSRPNMIAWVAARNDGAARGQVVVYQLPASTTIQGPTQIEARIDQNAVISAQISLWNQSGSQVIRGNLLVIPVGTSFLYLEPIYLQSTSSAFPQLTKVVVASSQTIGWGDTLEQALQEVVTGVGTGGGSTASGPGSGAGQGGTAGGATPAPGATSSPSAAPTSVPSVAPGLPTDVPDLVRYANEHFAAAKAAQAKGDFVAYGQEMQQVQAALNALGALAGGTPTLPPVLPTPLPAPSGSAGP